MDYKNEPLSAILQNREIFGIFDEEFHRGTWLDVTALLASDSTVMDLYSDGTVPTSVLDAVCERLATIK